MKFRAIKSTCFASTVALVTSVLAPIGFASAEDPALGKWQSAAELCVEVINNQNPSSLTGLREAPAQIGLTGTHEVSKWFENIVISAASRSESTGWFLCTGRVPGQSGPNETIEKAWLSSLNDRFPEPSFATVKFEHQAQVGPFKVACADDGLVVVFGYRGHPNSDFRVGVNDRLPNSVQSPCPSVAS